EQSRRQLFARIDGKVGLTAIGRVRLVVLAQNSIDVVSTGADRQVRRRLPIVRSVHFEAAAIHRSSVWTDEIGCQLSEKAPIDGRLFIRVGIELHPSLLQEYPAEVTKRVERVAAEIAFQRTLPRHAAVDSNRRRADILALAGRASLEDPKQGV